MTVPIAPPDFQGDLVAPDGTVLYTTEPWWVSYRAQNPTVVALVTLAADEPPLPPPTRGGWTSEYGYVSNWPTT